MKLKAESKQELKDAITQWFCNNRTEFADDRGEDGLLLDGHYDIADLVDALIQSED